MTTEKCMSLRKELIETARAMNEIGLNQGTAGNISIRCEGGFLITPSSLAYNRMQPDDIVFITDEGEFEGRRPSSEWRFHKDILNKRTDVNCVFHCHSIYATSLACQHREIPAFHYMVAVAGGPNIRCARYETFGTQALSDAALEALEDRQACLLGQHGQIALGDTLEKALSMAVEVESLAKIYSLVLQTGEPVLLSNEEIDRVIEQIKNMSYGMVEN